MTEVLPPMWGVTVEDVSALAPHVPIGEAPANVTADPVYGGRADRRITADEVQQWITDVSARADVALARRSQLSAEDQSRISAAVKGLVANGAAAYLVAAAFPAKAGLNDNTSYSAQLEARFNLGLAEYAAMIESLIEVAVSPEARMPGISGFFPPTRIPDNLNW
jgi:hypothetical protein